MNSLQHLSDQLVKMADSAEKNGITHESIGLSVPLMRELVKLIDEKYERNKMGPLF